jgi:C-methyltransferase C-terminal domain/Putative zinc binding domain/Methyltransferase domain
MIRHDSPPGKLERCQVCGTDDLRLVIDLGHQPLCDSLLTPQGLDEPEVFYPLRLVRCPQCGLAQLDYVVDGAIVYAPEYPYRSGITKELAIYQRHFAMDVISKLALDEGSLCVDIGSNDGTLLTGFRERRMRTLGVEPTNIARIAIQDNGIDTIQAFFTEAVAGDIVRDRGKASVVTATNVFAHMASLGEVMRGILALLSDTGVFITESHYLLDVIERTQYDTIYHEHLRTYCLRSLVRLFDMYDLDVFCVERASRYGGNIRAYVCRKGRRDVDPSVPQLLKTEEEAGLFEEPVYRCFRERTYASRDRLMDLAHAARQRGQSFIGNSCPGRCVTLLNFCGMRKDLMPYITEQPTSLKLGRYLPGLHIPIVDNIILRKEQPDNVVLLAWHYAEPIAAQLRQAGVRSKFILPLPEVRTLEV